MPPPLPDDESRWKVILKTRMKVDGVLYPAGTELLIAHGRLRVAEWMIRNGAARAANEETRVALAILDLTRQLP